MSYDTADGYVVLFGGASGRIYPNPILNDTWVRTGGHWLQLHPSVSPSPRFQAGIAYDARDGYVILFGGQGGSTQGNQVLNDTWEFKGGQWTQLTTPHVPPARFEASMAYDAGDRHVVLFGGFRLHDTWQYSQGDWKRITNLTVSPQARLGASMAYDPKDHALILFGGQGCTQNGCVKPVNDTWMFVNRTWTKLAPSHSPPAVDQAMMTYDVRNGALVLFGGWTAKALVNSTWSFVGGTWTNLTSANAPSPRSGAAMTYNPKGPFTLLFGGAGSLGLLNDTWKFQGSTWTKL